MDKGMLGKAAASILRSKTPQLLTFSRLLISGIVGRDMSDQELSAYFRRIATGASRFSATGPQAISAVVILEMEEIVEYMRYAGMLAEGKTPTPFDALQLVTPEEQPTLHGIMGRLGRKPLLAPFDTLLKGGELKPADLEQALTSLLTAFKDDTMGKALDLYLKSGEEPDAPVKSTHERESRRSRGPDDPFSRA